MDYLKHLLVLALMIALPSLADELDDLRKDAVQGNASAQFRVGFMYYYGEGVPQDYKEAIKWYRLAADQGDADAQFWVGVMYYKGEGVPQDFVQAHMWHNLAAAKGNEDARKNRDIIAKEMSPGQIERAQALASQWAAAHL